MNSFGLGIVLDFQDNASMNIMNVVNNFNILDETVRRTSTSIGDNATASLLAMNQFGRQLMYAGDAMQNAGKGLLGGFVNVGGKVKEVGSDFEKFRMTLTAMYDDEVAAEKQIRELLRFSAETPFDVRETKDLLLTLKAQGIEAFDQMSDSTGKARQEALAWIGDLKAFRPDVASSRWALALQNYIGSGEFKVLRNILDMGTIEQILGREAADTIEGRMQDIVDIVASKNLQGLMKKQVTTLDGMISNFEDQLTRIYLALGDAGVYERFKDIFRNLTSAFAAIDDDKLMTFAQTIAKAVDGILTPIEKLSKAIGEFIPKLIDFSIQHPTLTKIALGFLAVAGAGLIFLGTITKLFGGSVMFLASFQYLGGLPGILEKVKNGFTFLFAPLSKAFGLFGKFFSLLGRIPVLGKAISGLAKVFGLLKGAMLGALGVVGAVIAVLGLLYLAYKTNFLGLQKTLEPIFETLRIVGSFIFNGGALSVEDWEKADKMGIRPFLESLAQLGALFMDYVLPALKVVMKVIIVTLAEFLKWVGSMISAVVDIFSGFIDLIVGTFKVISGIIVGFVTGDWSLFCDGLEQAFGGAFKIIGGIVEGFINTVISAINWVIDLINLIPSVNIGKLNKIDLVSSDSSKNIGKQAGAANTSSKTTGTSAGWLPSPSKSSIPARGSAGSNLAALLNSGNSRRDSSVSKGAATGGYTLDTGLVKLHPNELIVNDKLTQRLDKFLTPERISGLTKNGGSYQDRYPSSNDYSVTFSQGSIVFNVNGSLTDTELETAAVKLMAIIERKQQLRKMATRR